MSARKISQREARRLRKRVNELEADVELRTRQWGSSYPGGVHITSFGVAGNPEERGAMESAQKLGAALVARCTDKTLMIFAVLPKARQ